jgi:sugar transferase (PEP-CTERM/EpsH1 system associated)
MNILLVSPWFPWPPFGGALIRVLETLRYLSRRNRVTLLAPVSHPLAASQLSAINELCETVVAVPVSEALPAVLRRLATGLFRGMPLIQSLHHDAGMARQLRRLTSLNAYDIIHVEHSFMAPYMAYVSPQSSAKRVLCMHNIESLRFERERRLARWGIRRLALSSDHFLFGAWEERAVQRFDAIVAVSALEEAWIREHAAGAAVALAPNGVNTDYFGAADPSGSSRSIIFTGLMNYPPNVDAVVWFCDAVLPILTRRCPEIRFTIVGDKPTPRVLALSQRAGVRVTGRVDDVRPYLADCAALVVPVRSGAGTRLKILEAMAMRRPVVSTRLGAEGLGVVDGMNVLLGDSPEEFADHLCALIANPGLARRLGEAGRQLVETEYDWKLCFSKLDTLYASLTDGPRVPELRPVQEFS